MEKPRFFVNGNQTTSIYEHTSLQLSCFVDGNPTPNITMIKGTDIIRINKSHWFNHSVESARCADTDTYSCIGATDGFNNTKQRVEINVICKYNYTTCKLDHCVAKLHLHIFKLLNQTDHLKDIVKHTTYFENAMHQNL